jgi:hypothetical protein
MTASIFQTLKSLSLVALLAPALLSSCATTRQVVPYTGLESQFIPDARPLRNPNSTDLKALAETLPIFHSGDSKTWVRNSNTQDGEWLTRIGDPKTPVSIKRLPSSPQGAQRISVLVGPSIGSTETPPPTWVYDLERTSGGWNQIFSQ